MLAFIDEHRDTYGVEPLCKVLPLAPSTDRLHAARRRDRSLLPERARRDPVLMEEIERVFETNYSVYGARKVWRQLRREGRDAARCTVERRMRDLGLAGALRGKPVKTTGSDKAAACPLDKVNRQFQAPAPNRLWVADFTYVATWAGFVYVAFVIDAFARRIVGWRVSRTAHASFVLDALEQAIHARCCFSHFPVEPPRELSALFRRRVSWDDGAIREPTGAGVLPLSRIVVAPAVRMWARGRRVWARGGASAQPLVQALPTRSVEPALSLTGGRRPVPKDASTSSPLTSRGPPS